MKQYTIGREEGPLNIPANASSVSRQHARITIEDDGVWVLESLADHKPIFIRQENGSLLQVSKKRITPSTVVVLGSPDVTGFSFKAADVEGQHKTDPLRYRQEYTTIRAHLERIQHQEKAYKKKAQIWGWIGKLGGLFAMVIAFAVIPMFMGDANITDTMTVQEAVTATKAAEGSKMLATRLFMGIFPVLLAILAAVFVTGKDDIKEQRKRLLRCPNPQCNCRLSDEEIELGKCNRCKSHC